MGVASAETLATINVRVITKLYLDKKMGKGHRLSTLKNKLNQLLMCGNAPFDLLIVFSCSQ